MNSGSWVRTQVRRGDKYGMVESDSNGYYRILYVRMSDDSECRITMNNVGPDPNPKELHQWEWETDKGIWYRF